MDLNIQRSKKINAARLKKMEERNKCLDLVKASMKERLKKERTSNRARYLATVKNLIVQVMIKLLEPHLKILCRQEDKNDLQKSLDEMEKLFTKFMMEKTGREYTC